MKKLALLSVALLVVTVYAAYAVPLGDDFDRPDGDVGNDWDTVADGTIKIQIVNNEVLISGQQGIDWRRSGIQRTIEGETKIYFDFLADADFNVHIRVDDLNTQAYIDVYAPPGSSFHYANSTDGGWPGWTDIPGSNMIPAEYNTLGLVQEGKIFTVYLNDQNVQEIKNPNLLEMTQVLISCDSAAGTVGELHIDNVLIGEPEAGSAAVDASGKLAVRWADIRR